MRTNKKNSLLKPSACACCASPRPLAPVPPADTLTWNLRYGSAVVTLATLWWLAFTHLPQAAHWLIFGIFGLAPGSRIGAAVEFFVYDTAKILLLLVALIYAIAWMRASLNVEKVRDFLAGKRRSFGYFLGSAFGAVTPFCSCSSIPLFLGFVTARIPVGITMAFLITSPLINELAVVMLWGVLGWKFTAIYVVTGMAAGMLGGAYMDSIKADRWLQPFVRKAAQSVPARRLVAKSGGKLTVRQRHAFASGETAMIFARVWKWVVAGVGMGAALHGFVPQDWFAENFSANQWWTVPSAVVVSLPLYSNVTGIIPVMESLLFKGLPVGTTLAFCMGATVASIPELMLLRQIMTDKLQAAFLAYLWAMLTFVGFLFNTIGPHIL